MLPYAFVQLAMSKSIARLGINLLTAEAGYAFQ